MKKDFFEWGFKILIMGAAALLIKTVGNISDTIQSLDLKFGVAITELKTQANFMSESVKDHESRIRDLERKKP